MCGINGETLETAQLLNSEVTWFFKPHQRVHKSQYVRT